MLDVKTFLVFVVCATVPTVLLAGIFVGVHEYKINSITAPSEMTHNNHPSFRVVSSSSSSSSSPSSSSSSSSSLSSPNQVGNMNVKVRYTVNKSTSEKTDEEEDNNIAITINKTSPTDKIKNPSDHKHFVAQIEPSVPNKSEDILLIDGRSPEKKTSNLPPYIKPASFEQDKKMLLQYSDIFQERKVNCSKLFNGDKQAVMKAVKVANTTKGVTFSDKYFINLTQNCDNFVKTRGYITSYLSEQEKNFPIAFSILAYKDVEMIDRLLRQIYRPQNFYCMHIDTKSPKILFKAVSGIAKCLPNVVMASTRIDVEWGRFSVLTPELVCMRDLYDKGMWKYFINLTGQEMPLKTNLELVQILTAYQGANDVEGTYKGAWPRRWNIAKNGPPPAGLRPIKGSVHITVNRDFVHYILYNPVADQLLGWVKQTYIPDETFFTMLNHNPHLGIPGTYPGLPEADRTNRKPYMARFKNWKMRHHQIHHYRCALNRTRGICILSVGDLSLIASRPELFANKFHIDDDKLVLDCLEEKLYNDTRDGFLGVRRLDTALYEGLDFVIHQVGRNATRQFVQSKHYVV